MVVGQGVEVGLIVGDRYASPGVTVQVAGNFANVGV